MLAVIQKVEDGYVARFERHLKHSVEKVWSAITENDKLAEWFPELSVVNLSEGGTMKFDFPDGNSDELHITELKTDSELEYTWWGDTVRFELYPETNGCRLVLKRTIKTISNHTSKDLAGWHVCLDVIQALLNSQKMESRVEHWEKWYPQYVQLIAEVSMNRQ